MHLEFRDATWPTGDFYFIRAVHAGILACLDSATDRFLMTPVIENLEKLLADGKDNALLRYSLGNAYFEIDAAIATQHLERALSFDSNYSAAWKLLGKARTQDGNEVGAIDAYERGLEVAEKNGDIQAMKEMRVFLKRLRKSAAKC